MLTPASNDDSPIGNDLATPERPAGFHADGAGQPSRMKATT